MKPEPAQGGLGTNNLKSMRIEASWSKPVNLKKSKPGGTSEAIAPRTMLVRRGSKTRQMSKYGYRIGETGEQLRYALQC